ncbi:neuronal acetylcholine receptor subunit beta-4-like isoform X2 [Anneissia japonica]|nr:neuronal acetylcholine receptor subunit beta-4-like isoform X2 [Anneissia japonica]
MRFRYLIDVDERHQVFNGVSWIYQIWTDPRLSWDPLEFNETELFVAKLTQIWWPHLIYNNDASGTFPIIGKFDTEVIDALISSNGEVSVSFPIQHITFCAISIGRFPLDSQTCSIRIAPTGVPSTILKLDRGINNGLILDAVSEEGQWNIVAGRVFAESENGSIYPDGGEVGISSILYEIDICRKPNYYTLTITFPATIIMLMSLFVFFIPCDSGERMSYIVSLVLGVMIFQLFVEETLPKVSERPLLGQYVTSIFVVQVFIVSGSVVSVCLVNKSNRRVSPPLWIRRLASFCNHCVCFSKHNTTVDSSPSGENDTMATVASPDGMVLSTNEGNHLDDSKKPGNDNNIPTDCESWRTVAGALDIILGSLSSVFIITSICLILIYTWSNTCIDYRNV